MTEPERDAAAYAYLVGKYGENSPQANRFAAGCENAETAALLIEVALLCRRVAVEYDQ